MSKFDELRDAYKTHREKHVTLWRDARGLAHLIGREFRDYIGAPKSYRDFDGEKESPYVEVWAWEEGELKKPTDAFDVFERREEDGSFRFGVVVTLDYAENSWPKEPFGVTVQMRLTGTDCELKVAKERDFEFAIVDAAARQPVYEFMCEVLARGFAQEPWGVPKKKSIGFIQLG